MEPTFETEVARSRQMDSNDPLRRFREEFNIPQHEGSDCIYLCGNSLGLQPGRAREYVNQEMDDWAQFGVEGHFQARHPWMPYHEFLTQNMAAVVGANPSEVVVMNSLTVNLHLLMVSFYRPQGSRRKILIEHDIFPSDLYAVSSQVSFHGGDPEQDLVFWRPRVGEHLLNYDDLDVLLDQHGDELALVMLGGVNYYTGQSFDLKRITSMCHERGIVVGFDLAHGAGNINYTLHDSGADFAAWCSYKYLNSGPGGLSGIFVHERHHSDPQIPRFTGWWGHNKETRFGMRDPFDPITGAEGWQLSNPPILPMASLRASLEIFAEAGMDNLRAKSIKLTDHLHELINQTGIEDVEVITPGDSANRGCQLSLFVHRSGKQVFDYLASHGVIGDWREPNVIRIAPVPLYNSFEDNARFVELLAEACDIHIK